MENRIYLMDLFALYGELFTEKQKEYFLEYYFNNLTLSELSENYSVTRTAIHNSIKEVGQKLYDYESKLGLYQKRAQLLQVIDDFPLEQKNKIKDILE